MEELEKLDFQRAWDWSCEHVQWAINGLFKYMRILVHRILVEAMTNIDVTTFVVVLVLLFLVLRFIYKKTVKKHSQSLAFPEVDKLKVAEMNGKKVSAKDGKAEGKKFLMKVGIAAAILLILYFGA